MKNVLEYKGYKARIEFDGQGFVLVDLGSNPTRVDGQALGRGRPAGCRTSAAGWRPAR